MSEPPFDHSLATDLNQVEQKLHQLEHSLYGCACDPNGLCALHAGFNNRLREAARQIHIAINALER